MPGWQDTPYGPVWLDDNGMPAPPPLGAEDIDVQTGAGEQVRLSAAEQYRRSQPTPPPNAQNGSPVTQNGYPVPGGSVGGSFSQSVAYTPQARVDELAAAAARDYGAAEQWGQAEYGNILAPMVAQNREAGRRIISDEEYRDAPSEAAVTTARANAQAQLQRGISDLYGLFQREEQAAQVAGQNHINAALADYQTSVQQYAAMQVNPTQWWDGLSTGEQAGTLASVFVANFLGMRGRPTTVMATINQAIDRNIAAQEFNINQKGQVAGMYRQMYDMAVAQSATQAEARERLRGYHLAQVQNEISAELARYDAPLAQAKLAEARAALDGELMQTALKIREYVGNRVQAIHRNWTDIRQSEISAAAQRYATRVAAEVERERIAAQTKPSFDPTTLAPYLVYDSQGNPIAKGHTEKEAEELRQKVADGVSILKVAGLLEQASQKAGMTYRGGLLNSTINDPDARAVQALEAELTRFITLESTGKASTESERNAIRKMVEQEGWMTNGDNIQLLKDFASRTAMRLNDQAARGAQLTAQDMAAIEYYGMRGAAGVEVAPEWDAWARTQGPVETEADRVIQRVRAPDSNDAADDWSKNAEVAWNASVRDSDPNATPGPVPKWFDAAWNGVKAAKKDTAEAEKLDTLLEAYETEAAGDPVRLKALDILRDELGVRVKQLNTDYDPTVDGPLVVPGIESMEDAIVE